ncbi:hypothetical protein BaRGS_00011121, partial [Batillaria attramentaria]
MFLDPGTTLCTDFQPSASAAYELHTRETTGVLPAGDASETLVGKFIVFTDQQAQIRPALEKQARRTFTKFTPIWSKSQVVAGMNYKIVIDVDSAPDYVSASVYKNTRGQCRFGWDWTRDVPPGSLM